MIWFDGRINSDTVVDYLIENSDEVILRYKFKVLTINTTRGVGRYYFSNEFKIDPKPFLNHNYGNWAIVSRETRSPSLKTEIENDNFSLVFEAINSGNGIGRFIFLKYLKNPLLKLLITK
ncbi:MAG: hypothetical protein ABJG78_00090 [Cyclobacteriaceae bacterium]